MAPSALCSGDSEHFLYQVLGLRNVSFHLNECYLGKRSNSMSAQDWESFPFLDLTLGSKSIIDLDLVKKK